MTAFAEDLEKAAGDEPITHAVIGDMGWAEYGQDERHAAAAARRGVVLPWSEARPLLDYAYDGGYGAPDCQAVYAWTETQVIYVSQYDGSTSVYSLPRNPVDCDPEMPGGG